MLKDTIASVSRYRDEGCHTVPILQAEKLANESLEDNEKSDFVPQGFDALRKVRFCPKL